jgi:hypothetical protein
MEVWVLYLSWRKSLGAAQAEAQCIRWKTTTVSTRRRSFWDILSESTTLRQYLRLTLLDTVLLGLAGLLLLLHDALSALIVVVLERGALLGLHALCMIVSDCFRLVPCGNIRASLVCESPQHIVERIM